jgi:hypothetical protein
LVKNPGSRGQAAGRRVKHYANTLYEYYVLKKVSIPQGSAYLAILFSLVYQGIIRVLVKKTDYTIYHRTYEKPQGRGKKYF